MQVRQGLQEMWTFSKRCLSSYCTCLQKVLPINACNYGGCSSILPLIYGFGSLIWESLDMICVRV